MVMADETYDWNRVARVAELDGDEVRRKRGIFVCPVKLRGEN